jgi:hypothetical protein
VPHRFVQQADYGNALRDSRNPLGVNPLHIAANNLPAIVQIVQDYFFAKGFTVAEKYFWKNSVAAYKWIRRTDAQPQLPG